MALQQADRGRVETGGGVGQPHGAFLAFLGWHEQAAAAAVVGQADAADQPEYRLVGGQRVAESHQGDQDGTFGGDQAVGLAVEGAALPGAAHRGQRAEADVDEQVVGAVDASGEHEVGGALVQPVAGQFDRVQRGGAGRVQGVAALLEPECSGGQDGRQAGVEPVTRVGAAGCGLVGVRAGVLAGQPDLLGVAGHGGGGEGQVADHQPAVCAAPVARPPAGLGQGLPAGVQQPVAQRVQAGQFAGGQLVAGRVEGRLKAADVAADVGPGAVRVGLGAERGRAWQPPPALRRGREAEPAGEDVAAEGVRVQRVR